MLLRVSWGGPLISVRRADGTTQNAPFEVGTLFSMPFRAGIRNPLPGIDPEKSILSGP
jgi:hypothetical protein